MDLEVNRQVWTNQNHNQLHKSQELELLIAERFQLASSDYFMIEEIFPLLLNMVLKTPLIGKSTYNNWIITTTCQSSSKVSVKRSIHTDSSLCKECLICWIKVAPRSYQSFLNWLFQSRQLWILETQKLFLLLLRSCKHSWLALIRLEKLWCHTTDRFCQSWTYSRLKTWTWETRSTTARERDLILEIWFSKPLNYLRCMEERMLSLISSTWYPPMSHACWTERPLYDR